MLTIHATQLADSNPFATRWTRPDAMEYCFPAGRQPVELLDRCRVQGWWGQIVGPHGSGKSTLLARLVRECQAAGRCVHVFVLRAGERTLAWSPVRRACDARTQVMVDGYEQLRPWTAWRLRRACRRTGCGLLVTAHRAVAGLPLLYRTVTDVELAVELAEKLQRAAPHRLSRSTIATCYAASGGNLREAFFTLYDLYERERVPTSGI